MWCIWTKQIAQTDCDGVNVAAVTEHEREFCVWCVHEIGRGSPERLARNWRKELYEPEGISVWVSYSNAERGVYVCIQTLARAQIQWWFSWVKYIQQRYSFRRFRLRLHFLLFVFFGFVLRQMVTVTIVYFYSCREMHFSSSVKFSNYFYNISCLKNWKIPSGFYFNSFTVLCVKENQIFVYLN